MADYALFVSEQEIKDTSMLNDNVDEKTIRFGVETAQDDHILSLLGSGLFDQLQSQILAGSISSQNVTLLAKIQKTVVWYTLYELHPFLNYKYMNKSIMQRQGDETTPISKDEMDFLAQYVKNKAEMYGTRVRNYLIENQATYTLYINPGSASDTIHPRKDSFDIGINLTKYGPKNKNIESQYDVGDCL